MKGIPLSAILDGASRLLDIGGTRVQRNARDPSTAALRDLREAWADVAGELRAVVAEEAECLDAGPPGRIVERAPGAAIPDGQIGLNEIPGIHDPLLPQSPHRPKHGLLADDEKLADARDRMGMFDEIPDAPPMDYGDDSSVVTRRGPA